MAGQSSLARLEACCSMSDYALWILTESDSNIRDTLSYARIAMSIAGFKDGHSAIVARMMAINAQRLPDGSLPQTVLMRLEEQKSRMREVISRGAV
jgi:hypothetical protein